MRAHSPRDHGAQTPAGRPRTASRLRAWGLLDACFELGRTALGRRPRLGVEALEPREQPSGSDVIDIGSLLAGGLAGWQTFEGGGTAGPGSAAVVDGDLVLAEGDSFLVGVRRTITLGSDPGVIRFAYDPVAFDRSAARQMRDAFEVALVDAAGVPLVPAFSPAADSYLNVTEGVDVSPATGKEASALGAAGTDTESAPGQTRAVRLDVSDLAPGSSVTIVFRLVNPDSDTGTRVRIKGEQPPAVTLTGSAEVTEGATYTLGLSAGNVYDDPVDHWAIDWQDGTTETLDGTATSATHVYADGTAAYTPSVTAVLANGLTGTAQKPINVPNVAPTVTPSGTPVTATAEEPASVVLGTFTDPGFTFDPDEDGPLPGTEETFTATIDWGDGTAPEEIELTVDGGPPSVGSIPGTHTYATHGTYTVTVTVRDDDGGVSSVTPVPVTVAPAPTDPGAWQVPGMAGDTVRVQFDYLAANTTADELGYFVVTDARGRVNGLLPTAPGYAGAVIAALAAGTGGVIFPQGSQPGGVGGVAWVNLPAGSYVGFYLVQDGTTAGLIAGNPTGGLADTPHVWFSTAGANADDGTAHLNRTDLAGGWVRFGGEDGDFGGDADFDDAVFRTSPAQPGPVIELVAAASGQEGTPVALTGRVAHANANASLSATVDWGDGVTTPATLTPAGSGRWSIAATHPYADDATYTVTVTVTEASEPGYPATRSVRTTAENVGPTLTPAADRTVRPGEPLSLSVGTFTDPGFTFDPDGPGPLTGTEETFTATIDWGDLTPPGDGTVDSKNGSAGTPTTGAITGQHTYTSPGTYTVTVTVRDDDGGGQTRAFQITVASSAPVVGSASIAGGSEGQSLALSAAGTDADPADQLEAVVHWGDGTSEPVGVSLANGDWAIGATHTYADDGPYNALLVVTDRYGNVTTYGGTPAQPLTAAVANVAPALTPGATAEATAGELQTFALGTFTDPGFTFDPDGPGPLAGTEETFTATVNWGDGTGDQTAEVVVTNGSAGAPTTGTITGQHVYPASGSYTVTVRLHDDDSPDVSATLRVNVFSFGLGEFLMRDVLITGVSQATGITPGAATTPDKTLVVSGTGEPGATITVTRQGVGPVGTTVVGADGTWRFDYTATTLAAGTAVFTATQAGFGPLAVAGGFNAFIFGDVSGIPDAQGRLAAGGNVTLSNFSIGRQLAPSNGGRDDLIAGGAMNLIGGRVYAGNVVYAGTRNITPNTTVSSGTVRRESVIDFAAAETYLRGRADVWGGLAPTGTTTYTPTGDRWAITLTGYEPLFNVFTVDGAKLAACSGFTINAPAGSTVLVNVTGTAGRMAEFAFDLNGVSKQRVLYNFPQAATLFLDGIGVLGSVLAPRADVTFPGGNLDGTLIARSLTGGGELHHFLLQHAAPSKTSPEFVVTVQPAPTEAVPKFFVVGPGLQSRYNQGGSLTGTAPVAGSGTPVGIVANAAGTGTWVVTANPDGTSTVTGYDADGSLRGRWRAYGVTDARDVGTNGTDVWVVGRDAATGALKVFRYANGTKVRTGGIDPIGSFALNAANANPTGLATDGWNVFVTDKDATGGRVWAYDVNGARLGSAANNPWRLDARNADPSGVALNPLGGKELWVVDKTARQVFTYSTGRNLHWGNSGGPQAASGVFTLAAGTPDPEGISDPAPPPPVIVLDSLGVEGPLRPGDTVLVTGRITGAAGVALAVTVNGVDWVGAQIDAGGRFFVPVTVQPGETVVAIRGTAASDSGVSDPAPVPGPTVTARYAASWPTPNGPVDFAALDDVTPAVRPVYGRTTFNQRTGVLHAGLSARHMGLDAIRAPLLAVVSTSDPAVTPAGTAGVTPPEAAAAGRYYDLSANLPGGDLTAGETTTPGSIAFANPGWAKFTNSLSFLGSANRPPRFVAVPRLEALAGRRYQFASAVADPDAGDRLIYRLVAGPAGLQIDPATGVVTWDVPATAGPEDHRVVLEVRDSFGRSDTLEYSLTVRVGGTNRPPRVESDPATEAVVGSAFGYTVRAVDPDGNAVRYTLASATTAGGAPITGVTVDATTGRVSWVPPSRLAGQTVSIAVRAEDVTGTGTPVGGVAVQTANVRVLPVAGNHAPAFVTRGPATFQLPGVSNPASPSASPGRVDLDIPLGVTSAPVSVSFTPGPAAGTDPDGLAVTRTTDAAQLLASLLAGGQGLTNVSVQTSVHDEGTGAGRRTSTGLFANTGRTYLLPGAGLVLSTGNVADYATGPNRSTSRTTAYGNGAGAPATAAENALLAPISGHSRHYDVTRIDITFDVLPDPQFDHVEFNVVFGSEEWPEYFGSFYSDAFGLFLNNENIATVNDSVTGDPLPVSSNHPDMKPVPDGGATAEQLARVTGTELDGILAPNYHPVLTFSRPVQPGSTGNVLTFIIADTIDANADTTAYFWGLTASNTADVRVKASDPTVVLTATPDVREDVHYGTAAPFEITIEGDGRARAFDLLFYNPETGETLGSLPVTVNNDLRYDGDAVDADGDTLRYWLLSGPAGAAVDGLTGVLKWEPAAVGSYTFEVLADDGRGGLTVQKFTVNVVPTGTNADPVITADPPTAAAPDQRYLYRATATDAETAPLEYYLTTKPDGMGIDRWTGVVTWTPTAEQSGQSHPVTVKVVDGRGGVATRSFEVAVSESPANAAPAFGTITPPAVRAGAELRLALPAADADHDALTFALDQAPPGVAIDPVRGLIVWTPTPDQGGSAFPITVRVRDGRGGEDVETFTVPVGTLNHAPEVFSTPAGPATASSPYRYAVAARDADGNPPAFSLVSPLTGMSVDAAGVFTWTPAAGQVGTRRVTIRVDDLNGGVLDHAFDLVVTGPNAAPSVSSFPVAAAVVGEEYRYEVVATDPDGPVTVTLGEHPGWLRLEGLRLVGTPTESDVTPAGGTGARVVVRVADGREGVREQAFDLPVLPRPNRAPVIALSAGPLAVAPGVPTVVRGYVFDPIGEVADMVDLVVAVTDPDRPAAGEVAVTVDGLPPGLFFNDVDGTITGFAQADFSGFPVAYTVRVRADDGRGGVAEDVFDLTVVSPFDMPVPNAAPEFGPLAVAPAVVGRQYTLTPTATDPDPFDAVTVTATVLPLGASFVDGVFTWTPTEDQVTPAGTPGHEVELTASDGLGGFRILQIELPVVSAVGRLPAVSASFNQTVIAGQPVSIALTAADPGGAAATLAPVGNLPAWLALTSPSGTPGQYVLSGVPPAGAVGAVTFALRTTGAAGSTEETFTLRVAPGNRAPVLTTALPAQVGAGQTYRGAIRAADPDGDPVRFEKQGGPDALTVGADGTVTWATTEADANPNPYTVTVRVTDDRGPDQYVTFQVEVTAGVPANRLPVVTSLTPISAVVGQELLFAPTAGDDDGDPLTWSADGAPVGLTIDPATGAFRWTPREDQVGTHAFTLRVSDPRGGAAAVPVTVVVRGAALAPRFETDPPTAARAGFPLAYAPRVVSPDGQPVTLRMAAGVVSPDPAHPEWSMRFEDGVFRWTPRPGVFGTFTARIEATDARGRVTVQELSVVVTDANRAPSFAPVADRPAVVGAAFTAVLAPTDPDGDVLTYGLVLAESSLALPGGGTLPGDQLGTIDVNPRTGELTWHAPPAAGTARLRVSVSDGTVTRYAWLTVSVRATNQAPALAPQDGPGFVAAGGVYGYDLLVDNPEGDPLTFTCVVFRGELAVPMLDGLSVDPRGRLRWRTAATDHGWYTVRVTVTDPLGLSDTQDLLVWID